MKPVAYKEMYENEIDHAWYVATRNLMIKNISRYLKEKAKILDAGCGTGGTIIALQKAGFKNVYGIDNNKDALKYCRIRGIKNIKMGDINSLNLKEGSFDAVICMDVLYHKDVKKDLVLNSFYKLLKKRGLLYLQEPAFNWLKSKHDIAIETNNRFTAGKIKNNVQDAGFEVIELSYFNFFLSPLIIFKRILNNVFVTEKINSDVGHVNPIFNFIVLQILNLEIKILDKINLPFGISIICLVKK